ncbi:hypothetical protein WN944_008851 [Citrus x changshan-huyou]|uniref:SWIM-type domain-containing protein n=1 Tax=Citrus x changshan-huyou TaxID=2935761 RepID=A0AAP0QVM3_9ROSI
MDDDDITTVLCTFKGKTYNVGVIDPDKFSRVSVINKVLVRVYGRKMRPDEKFTLSVWVPWVYKEVEIMSDHDLIFQLREHNKMLFYCMQLYIEEIHVPHEFVPRRALFQHSAEESLQGYAETNFPATTDLHKPYTHATSTNTNPYENDSNDHSNHEPPVKNSNSIMMHNVVLDSIQSQTKPDTNPDLYQDFLDTYFRSSPQQKTPSAAQTNAENSDSDNTSSFGTNKTPTEQLQQNFAISSELSPLLQQHGQHASQNEPIPFHQPEFSSQPITQNPQSQVVQAENFQQPEATTPALVDYNSDDSHYSVTDSEEDPDHPLGAPNINNTPRKPSVNVDLGSMPSDDSDGDCMLSDCESDDNEFGEESDEEIDQVLVRMDAVMRENMYIPSDTPVQFFIGQCFRNFRQLAWAIRTYAVENKFKVYKHKFEKSRVTVGCNYFRCPWFLHVAKTRFGQTFIVRRLHNVHTCQRDLKNPECTAEFITAKFAATIIEHPDTKVGWIQGELRRMFGAKIHKYKIYRAKKKVLQRQGADYESSYMLIRNYAQAILTKMPQALALVKVFRMHGQQPQTHFDSTVISFPALRDGFNQGCRPFIGIDGCHLKGPYKGVLLSAVAIDANNGIFPLAFCVCSVESTTSWTWFLSHFREFLQDTRQLTFMCDRQKGIQNALALEFPNAHVRFCARHILANLKSKHPQSDFKAYFWAAARASNRRAFDDAMQNIRAAHEGVYETLRRIPPKFWSRHAFDNNCKSDHCTNNVTESFNAWIGIQRKLPIISMLEWIRKKLMKRMIGRRNKAESWDSDIPRRIYAQMMKNLQIGSANPICRASEWLYEVDENTKTYIVDLEHHMCDCGQWQVSGIPCVHAMPCIVNSQKDQAQFISQWLKKDTYLRCYSGLIKPIPDRTSWVDAGGDEILPPLVRRPPGRPKMTRRREADEVPAYNKRYKMQCTVCKGFGHNRRGCPVNPHNAHKTTRQYKNNLKKHVTRTNGEQSEGQVHGITSTILESQDNDMVQVTVSGQNITKNQQTASNKRKIGNQAGPSKANEVIGKSMKGVISVAPWVGEQGRKVMSAAGLTFSREDEVGNYTERKHLDKGKAPAFPS